MWVNIYPFWDMVSYKLVVKFTYLFIIIYILFINYSAVTKNFLYNSKIKFYKNLLNELFNY